MKLINWSKATRLLTCIYRFAFDKGVYAISKARRFRRQREPFRALAGLLATGIALCSLLFALQKNETKEVKTKSAYVKTNATKIDYQIYALKELRSITQFNCLITLWIRESNWRIEAHNSGHWGIPQGKSIYLKTANGFEQVSWGIKYIRSRYGVDMYNKPNVCLALGHSYKRMWY